MFVLVAAGHVGPRTFTTRKAANAAAKFYSRKFGISVKVLDLTDLLHDLSMQSLLQEYWSALPQITTAA